LRVVLGGVAIAGFYFLYAFWQMVWSFITYIN